MQPHREEQHNGAWTGTTAGIEAATNPKSKIATRVQAGAHHTGAEEEIIR